MDLSGLAWRKSSYSASEGECVEVAWHEHGVVVRDSKNPNGGVLACGEADWRAFIEHVRQDA